MRRVGREEVRGYMKREGKEVRGKERERDVRRRGRGLYEEGEGGVRRESVKGKGREGCMRRMGMYEDGGEGGVRKGITAIYFL